MGSLVRCLIADCWKISAEKETTEIIHASVNLHTAPALLESHTDAKEIYSIRSGGK